MNWFNYTILPLLTFIQHQVNATVWPARYWVHNARPWRYMTGCGWEMKTKHWNNRHCDHQHPELNYLHPKDLKKGNEGFEYFCHQYEKYFFTDYWGYPKEARYSRMYRRLYEHHNSETFQLRGPGFPRNFIDETTYMWKRWRWERWDCHLEYDTGDDYLQRCFHQLCLTLYCPGRLGPAHDFDGYVADAKTLEREKAEYYMIEYYFQIEEEVDAHLSEFVLTNMTLPNLAGKHAKCRRIKRPTRQKFLCYSTDWKLLMKYYVKPDGFSDWEFYEELAQFWWDLMLTNVTYPHGRNFTGQKHQYLFEDMANMKETVLKDSTGFTLYRHVPISDPARLPHWKQPFLRPMRSFQPDGWLKQNPKNLTECITLDMGTTVLCAALDPDKMLLKRMTLYHLLDIVVSLITNHDPRYNEINDACYEGKSTEFYNVLRCKDDDIEYRIWELGWHGGLRVARRSVRFLMNNAFFLHCPTKYFYPNPYSDCWEGEIPKYYQLVYQTHPVDIMAK